MAQERGEPIANYLNRFKEKLTKVNVPEDAAMAAFRKGLIPGSPLRKDLNIREPKDLDDALHRASRFALDEEEEARIAAKTQDEQPSHPPKVKNRVEHHEPRKHHEPQDRKKGVIHAVSEVDDQEKQPSDPKELYCDFHTYPGHSTQECVHLKNYLYVKYLSGEVEATYQPKSARGGRGRRGGWRGGRSNRGHGAGGGRGYDGPPNAAQQLVNQAPANHQEEAPQADELPGPPKRQRGQNPERVNSPPRGRITTILGPPEDCADSVRALKKRHDKFASFKLLRASLHSVRTRYHSLWRMPKGSNTPIQTLWLSKSRWATSTSSES
ncbi:PREDICTED: uncharacterized protein LOC104789776 [Camelina sativa]|nr:PREDICTED: uncharacterized protein LOC104789776 [Camelina sativa]